MENQRISCCAALEALDATNEYQMVTARVLRLVGAFKPGRTAFDQWYIGQSTANAHIAKTILVTTGESVGYDLLVGRKHVDRVVAGTTERFQPW